MDVEKAVTGVSIGELIVQVDKTVYQHVSTMSAYHPPCRHIKGTNVIYDGGDQLVAILKHIRRVLCRQDCPGNIRCSWQTANIHYASSGTYLVCFNMVNKFCLECHGCL